MRNPKSAPFWPPFGPLLAPALPLSFSIHISGGWSQYERSLRYRSQIKFKIAQICSVLKVNWNSKLESRKMRKLISLTSLFFVEIFTFVFTFIFAIPCPPSLSPSSSPSTILNIVGNVHNYVRRQLSNVAEL